MIVVNVKRIDLNCTHYIGRGTFPEGKAVPVLANRYSSSPSSVPGVVRVTTRKRAIELFEQDARNSPEILAAIDALPPDAVLGCWCSPLPCHGHVIVKIWKERHPE